MKENIQEGQDLQKPKKKKPWWLKLINILWRSFLVLFVLLILLILFIRSPWGQNIIVGELTKYVSKKTKTEVHIDKLFITLKGDINLQGLYVEDQKGDTLVYSKELQAGIPVIPIIKGQPLSLNRLSWTGLRANVSRDSLDEFNFQFIIDAFAGETPEETPEEKPVKDEKQLPKINVGDIDFSDFKLNYSDDFSGMYANVNLGEFFFRGKNIDLNEMRFEAKALDIKNTKLSFIQTKAMEETPDTSDAALPFLSLDRLTFTNVRAFYQSAPVGMEAEADLKEFLLEVPKADLANQDIEINQLLLNESDIRLFIEKQSEAERKAEELGDDVKEEVKKAVVFQWPDWKVKVKDLNFTNNHLAYQNGHPPKIKNRFNPDDIDLSHFNLNIQDLILSEEEQLTANFKELSFEESSGLNLHQLHFNLDVQQQELILDDFLVETDKNKLQAQLNLKYESIDDFINQLQKAEADMDLKDFSIDLKEAFAFAPELRNNEYILKLSRNRIRGNLSAKGSMADLNLKNLSINWANTQIRTRGRMRNLDNPERLYAAIDHFRLNSVRNDVLVFVSEEEAGISIPQAIHLQSQLYGSLDDLKTKTLLQIPEGEIFLDGGFTNREWIAFHADLNVKDFDLGKILNNPNIGKIELTLNTEGEGNSVENLTANLNTEFSKLEFNNYDFSALKIRGALTNGDGSVILNYLDENLDMVLASKIHLDSLGQKVAADLDIKEADLNKLNLMEKKIKTNLSLIADFENIDGAYTLESHLIEGNILFDNKVYLMGPLNLIGHIKQDSTALALDSKIVSGQLAANAEPAQIGKAVERQLKRYFKDIAPLPDTFRHPVKVDVDMRVSPHPLLTEVFVPGIVAMDTLQIQADFDQAKDILTSNVSLSYLNFQNNIINDLYFDINSAADVANFILGFENLDSGGFGMYRTYLTGDLTEGVLTANFFSFDEKEELFFALHSQASGNLDHMKFHLLPYNLILNNEEWNIPEDNEISLIDNKIEAHNFVLNKDGREFIIANDLIKTKRDNIGLGFKDFQLETLLALFNPEKHLAEGDLQGNIVAVNPLGKIGFLADFGIDNLNVLRAPLGDLSLRAFARDLNQYRFKMDLKGSDVDLEAGGNFLNEEELTFNLDFNLNRFGMQTLAGLSQNELTQGSGYLSGDLKVKGTSKNPVYQGHLRFNEASFRVAQLNTKFTLDQDDIDITEKGLDFRNFIIQDENNNELSIEGYVSTKRLTNPKFDLRVNTKNFQLMNSTEEDNDLFYGKVNVDLNGTIKGSASAPDLNMNINLNKNTDFTYALSATQAALESQEGVVEFVNRSAPVYVLEEEKDSVSTSARFTGINLHANVNISKGAKFGVIVDPRTNDHLEISGNGALDFRMTPNGQMDLSGRYTIDEGYYSLSLYNLVKRRFDFSPGSSITWTGSPMDADLDVSAIYAVKASPAGLMGGGARGMSEEDRNRFKQKLPFLVSLNVGGSIDKPLLSFGLDMEEESKGAMEGSVYSRIRQMQDDEGERNKQVFSLLVLNRFFPEGSDGGGGGFASMARDNLNQALTDQLNNFSDQFTGESGFKLNFGLESYETYSSGSAQQRTDLDITAEQRLLNDRLVVKAGTEMNIQGDLQPGEERPLLGNVSIEYLVTEDGRWRLRGFRKNEYENVIDGQVFINGIGVIFQRDFNRFGYLWRSMWGNPEKYYAKQREKRKKENKPDIKKESIHGRNEEETLKPILIDANF